jgi:hypothetical protein
MSLQWFLLPGKYPTSLADLVAQLEPFGIVMGKVSVLPAVYYQDLESEKLVKEIGELYVRQDGNVLARPRAGTTDDDRIHLLKAGEVAFREKCTRKAGWYPRRGKNGGTFWRTTISVGMGPDDPHAPALLRAAQDVETRNDQAKDQAEVSG